MGLKHTILLCLEGLARIAVAQERMERVARLCGAAAALREDRGWPSHRLSAPSTTVPWLQPAGHLGKTRLRRRGQGAMRCLWRRPSQIL